MPPGMNVGPDCLGWLGWRQGQAAQAGWAEPGGQSKLVWQPGLAGHQESACSGGPFRGPWASLGPLGRPWNPLDVLGDQFGASWGPIWAPLEPPWASLLAQNAIYANAILYVTFPALILGVHGSPWACRGSFLSLLGPIWAPLGSPWASLLGPELSIRQCRGVHKDPEGGFPWRPWSLTCHKRLWGRPVKQSSTHDFKLKVDTYKMKSFCEFNFSAESHA